MHAHASYNLWINDLVWLEESTSQQVHCSVPIIEKLKDRCTYSFSCPLEFLRLEREKSWEMPHYASAPPSRRVISNQHATCWKCAHAIIVSWWKKKTKKWRKKDERATLSKLIVHHIAHQNRRCLDLHRTWSWINQVRSGREDPEAYNKPDRQADSIWDKFPDDRRVIACVSKTGSLHTDIV